MSYTALGVLGVVVALVVDLWVLRTRLVTRRMFWVAYAIIIGFQLLTNGVLTGARIVRYDGAAILGSTTPEQGRPPLIGDGRLFYAPIEDLLFGFTMVLLTLALWIYAGRRGVQREPYAGPPIRGWFGGVGADPRAGAGAGGSGRPAQVSGGDGAGAEAPTREPGLPPGG